MKTIKDQHQNKSLHEFQLIQHKLIPWTLITMNVVAAHFVYLFIQDTLDLRIWAVLALAVSMIIGMMLRHKYLLMASNSAYWIFLLLSLFFVA